MEATIQSPLRLLLPQSNSSNNNSSTTTSLGSNSRSVNEDLPPRPTSPTPHSKRYSASRHKQSKASRKLFETDHKEHAVATHQDPQKVSKPARGSSRDRLGSLLSKYERSQVGDGPTTRVKPEKVQDKKKKTFKVGGIPKEEQAPPKKIKFKPDIPRK